MRLGGMRAAQRTKRRINLLPASAFRGGEETLDVVGHAHFEMLRERMDKFAPAPSKLVEFAGDDLLCRRRRHRTWPASEPRRFLGRRRIRGSARLRRIHGSVARRFIVLPRREKCNENNEQAAARGHPQPAKTTERFTPR